MIIVDEPLYIYEYYIARTMPTNPDYPNIYCPIIYLVDMIQPVRPSVPDDQHI